MSLNRYILILVILALFSTEKSDSQCLSSVNPVGGSNNLLVLEPNSLRLITFYRYNYGDRYFEGSSQSDFNLIKNANYNYAGAIIGYGLAEKLTIETELGYFFNKTQNYNLEPSYSLVGRGFSNAVVSAKYSILKNNEKRFFISASLGPKIPFSTTPQVRSGTPGGGTTHCRLLWRSGPVIYGKGRAFDRYQVFPHFKDGNQCQEQAGLQAGNIRLYVSVLFQTPYAALAQG